MKKISKRNITTMSMEVKLVDFDKIKILAQKSTLNPNNVLAKVTKVNDIHHQQSILNSI